MTQSFKKGEVWLANLNPNKGAEPGKTRPVLILQDQALLDVGHLTTIVIPLTTTLIENANPLRIRVSAKERLERDSDLLMDQVRAIDNKRLMHGPLTKLTNAQMKHVYKAIFEVMGCV